MRFDPARYKLIENHRGGLRIWDHPRQDKLYVIGIDSASGMSGKDFSAASVIETASRALVATWIGKYDPNPWGLQCAMLGAYYNSAMLAFETHPSQHGLSACMAARDSAGYSNLYVDIRIGLTTHKRTERLGWIQSDQSRGQLYNRIKQCLADKNEIPSQELLLQLLTAKLDEKGRVRFDGHDDIAMSYGIAQCVCDLVAIRGWVTSTEERPRSWTERYWEARKEEWERSTNPAAQRQRLDDGC